MKILATMVAIAAATTMAMAGGDIAPTAEIEVYEPEKTGFYLGGAYGLMNAETVETANAYGMNYEATLLDVDFDSIMVNVGYNFHEYVAVEARYWFGLEQTADYGIADQYGYIYSTDASIDTWGLYVKPQYTMDSFKVYGLLGYASSEYTLTDKMANVSAKFGDTLDGFSWGLGFGYAVNDSIEVFIDYVDLYDDSNEYVGYDQIVTYDDTLSVVNFGVNYKF